jgi:hypothetical protein
MKDSDRQSPAREARRGDVAGGREEKPVVWRRASCAAAEKDWWRRGDSDEQAERECGEASARASGTEKGRGMSCCERRKRKQARRCCETEKGRGTSASGGRGGGRRRRSSSRRCVRRVLGRESGKERKETE